SSGTSRHHRSDVTYSCSSPLTQPVTDPCSSPERVTKALDVLVVVDPESLSGKAEKARSCGTRIMTEASFWRAVGLS
ncbi:BRCT domain-containing protein, partial [Modestobacter caceresii]|uniref:hypothetical protein n=1 Tax=Modestobacter caceresii TaxID=1522368 RepID=UPI0038B3C3F1